MNEIKCPTGQWINKVKCNLFQLLKAECDIGNTSCFLRCSRTPDILWITDAFRRIEITAGFSRQLSLLGLKTIKIPHGEMTGFDLSEETWLRLMQNVQTNVSNLPDINNTNNRPYGLMRTLLIHRAPLLEQPLEEIRPLLLYMSGSTKAINLSDLWEKTAVHLRKKENCASFSGLLLAEILSNQSLEEIL